MTAEPVPVPASFGSRVFACRVRGYALIGDAVYDGDVVLIDPDRRPKEGDLAAVTITWNGQRGRVLRRLRQGGWVLESSNPKYPPLRLTRENNPVADGLAVAVIHRLK
jgi:SOS-response transcriptional repressor LexA